MNDSHNIYKEETRSNEKLQRTVQIQLPLGFPEWAETMLFVSCFSFLSLSLDMRRYISLQDSYSSSWAFLKSFWQCLSHRWSVTPMYTCVTNTTHIVGSHLKKNCIIIYPTLSELKAGLKAWKLFCRHGQIYLQKQEGKKGTSHSAHKVVWKKTPECVELEFRQKK